MIKVKDLSIDSLQGTINLVYEDVKNNNKI